MCVLDFSFNIVVDDRLAWNIHRLRFSQNHVVLVQLNCVREIGVPLRWCSYTCRSPLRKLVHAINRDLLRFKN